MSRHYDTTEAIDRLRAIWIAAKIKQDEAREWADRAMALRILNAFKRRLAIDPELQARVASRRGFPQC